MRVFPLVLVAILSALPSGSAASSASMQLPKSDPSFLFAPDQNCEMLVDYVNGGYRVVVPARAVTIAVETWVALTPSVSFLWTISEGRPKFQFKDVSTNRIHEHKVGEAASSLINWGDCTTTVRVARSAYQKMKPASGGRDPLPLNDGEGLPVNWREVRP